MFDKTWEEAQEAMRRGKKAVHKYFCHGEFFIIRGGLLLDEEGYRMAGWYTGDDWQNTGWAIVE